MGSSRASRGRRMTKGRATAGPITKMCIRDRDSLQQDIDEMTQALADALNALEPATALDQLQALVDTANGYAADDYIQNDAWDTFEAALEKAEALLASTDPSQAVSYTHLV